MARDYENEDGVRIMPLSEMRDYQVAEGYPDIRGWRVETADGRHVGKVHELLVDADTMRTRYIDMRLTSDLAAMPGDRDVLVPIGVAQLDDAADRVIVPLSVERVGLLPPYTHGPLTRAYEYEVRRHFSLGEAAAAGAAAVTGAVTGAAATAATPRNFYDDASYDDRRFFSTRHTAPPATERVVETPRTVEAGGAAPAEQTTRIPLSPEESVSLRRGPEGHDEIIIRRPAT